MAKLDSSIVPNSNNSYDNIHPGLSHQDALEILEKSLSELEAASDYYMAASHLVNFPGEATEDALLRFIENPSTQQAVMHARRKAVEVLGRLGCKRATASIGFCLQSDDCYLVENAAWALLQLQCQDAELHQVMCQRLGDPAQSRRVLIQALAGLGVRTALPLLQSLQDDENPGVRGAATAAVAQLTGDRSRLQHLEDHLMLPNQMDRQTAIQDLIDCRATWLLPSIIKAPVSPVFRIRALRTLWPQHESQYAGLDLLACLDRLIHDNPDDVILVHRYDAEPSTSFLFEEFFGTDFGRSYLALSTLRQRPPRDLWPVFWNRWIEDAHNDYGAHYFFIQLLKLVDDWPSEALPAIQTLLLEAINNKRPQFVKSKSVACLALNRLSKTIWINNLQQWISTVNSACWELRYAVLMGLESFGQGEDFDRVVLNFSRELKTQDPDPFVEKKRQLLISENRVLKEPWFAQ